MRGRGPRARRAIGLGLLVPGLLLTHSTAAPAQGPAHKAPQKRLVPDDRCLHAVRSGDSVSRVAARYGATRQSLIAANHLDKPDALSLGQRLAVPGCRPARGGRSAGPETASLRADGSLEARVGPRRVLTRLFLSEPRFNGEAIEFLWPVEGPVLSGFWKRRSGWHAGLDIAAAEGTPVMAAAPGVVVSSTRERAYGLVVRIHHANGFLSVYAHNLSNLVAVGDEVEAGTIIASVGRTGRATAHHLHFEIRREGVAYNPLHLLLARERQGPPAGPDPHGAIAALAGGPAGLLDEDAGSE